MTQGGHFVKYLLSGPNGPERRESNRINKIIILREKLVQTQLAGVCCGHQILLVSRERRKRGLPAPARRRHFHPMYVKRGQTSTINSMSRTPYQHRIPNEVFEIMLKRKLRLRLWRAQQNSIHMETIVLDARITTKPQQVTALEMQ
eukprot:scaffold8187_cov42-Cyclotella_meneghiniana.AAC.8